MVVFFEARGEPVDCQVNVAQVVINRMKHYGGVISTVLSPHQFSWVRHKMLEGVLKPEHTPNVHSKEWKKAITSAQRAIKSNSNFKGTHFHTTALPKPSSWNTLVKVKTCGNHHFYKEAT